MYQVFGIHPGFSGEKYQHVLSAPEEPAACTVAEPNRTTEQNDGQGLTTVPTIQATPPATPGASPNTAKTVLPSAAAPAGSAVKKDVQAGPSQLSAASACGVSGVMDLDLDNLLAATSPARRSGTGTHAQRSRQATAASSTTGARGSQQSRQTPGKDAKKVLEDWLDL